MDVHARAKTKRQNAPLWKQKLARELLQPKRIHFDRRSVYSPAVDNTWTSDLMDLHRYVNQNKGYTFILVVLDIFSRFAWARPLKTKTGAEVSRAFQNIFNEGRIPKALFVDRGTEYYNRDVRFVLNGDAFDNPNVRDELQSNNIRLYSSFNEPKAVIAERFIRTLRGKIESNYILTQSTVWYDILPQLIHEYNTTYHRTIKMTPTEACMPENFPSVYRSQFRKHPPSLIKYNRGDHVRISVHKKTFEKGSTANWTEEIFEIVDILPTTPPTYKLKDLSGEEVHGAFYNEQLQKTDQQIYRVDKVLRRRKRGGVDQVFVRWSGYPDKFNQWIEASSIHHSDN